MQLMPWEGFLHLGWPVCVVCATRMVLMAWGMFYSEGPPGRQTGPCGDRSWAAA
jgi:hypothetical protein